MPSRAATSVTCGSAPVRKPKPKGNGDRYQPIPEVSSAVRYEDNVVSPGVACRALRVGDFSPAVFAGSVRGTLLKQWQPGQRIHFFEPGADAVSYGAAALVAVILGGFVSYQMAPIFADWLPGWATMTLAILLFPLIACAGVFLIYREREIVFDWPTGTLAGAPAGDGGTPSSTRSSGCCCGG